MERVKQLKLKLQETGQQGLALDIDETLAWTVYFWMEQMQLEFGNPENLSVEAMISKYRYTQNVPYWQTKEANQWMEECRHSNEVQEQLCLIEGAETAVAEINKIIPVTAYITSRPETVEIGTKRWLNQNQFPEAALITRPANISHTDGSRWKAEVLEILYPQIIGIVDDNIGLVQHLSASYLGFVFLFDNPAEAGDGTRVLAGKTWSEIVKHINQTRAY